MTVVEPTTRRWTRDEYYRLAEEGWFNGQRVQLIQGEIINMPPQGHKHTQVYLRALNIILDIFGGKYVRPQLPLNVPGESDPEPDLAVTLESLEYYRDHPVTALLVIEVADSSIQLDRRKANLYAAAGVRDYWIANVNTKRLEIFRDPVADQLQEFGHHYTQRLELGERELVSPLARPEAKIAVKSFFE